MANRQVNIRFSETLYERASRVSKQKGLSLSELIRAALDEYLSREETKMKPYVKLHEQPPKRLKDPTICEVEGCDNQTDKIRYFTAPDGWATGVVVCDKHYQQLIDGDAEIYWDDDYYYIREK